MTTRKIVIGLFLKTESYYAAKVGLNLAILLPQVLELQVWTTMSE